MLYVPVPPKNDIWCYIAVHSGYDYCVMSFLFQLWWVCTTNNFGSNLGYIWTVEKVGKVLYLCMLGFLALKQVGKVYIYACYVSKALHLPNVEILILYLLSIDDCNLAINLFRISWEPFENINLLYFLLKMQIWNGFNWLNIAGNLITYINVNLSILNFQWKVVECIPQALATFLNAFLNVL